MTAKPNAEHDPARHLDALDGLRGCAALAVFISHAANRGYLPGVLGQGFGAMGVALFYVLSGFLMAWLYLHRPPDARSIRDFVLRRAFRIVPLYYLAIAAAIVASLGFGVVLYVSDDPIDFLLALAFLRGRDVLWSIPVEVQFYGIFLFLWVLRPRGLFWPAIAALCIGMLVFHLAVDRGYNTIFKWGHFFILGMGIALWLRSAPARASGLGRTRVVQAVAVLALLGLPLALPGVRLALGATPLDANIDPVSALYPVLLLVLAVLRPPVFAVFETRSLRRLGDISFGVYLVHIPVLLAVDAAHAAGWLPTGLAFAVACLLTVALSFALHAAVERPARALGRRMTTQDA